MRMAISSQMEEALSLPSEKMSLIPWDTSENVPAKRHAAGSPLCPMTRIMVLTFYLLSLKNQTAVILQIRATNVFLKTCVMKMVK